VLAAVAGAVEVEEAVVGVVLVVKVTVTMKVEVVGERVEEVAVAISVLVALRY